MKLAPAINSAVIAVTALICVAALWQSVYPGRLQDLRFTVILFAILATPVVLLGLLIAALFPRLLRLALPWQPRKWLVLVVVGMLLSTYVLLRFYIPRRLAFAIAVEDFEALLQQAPVSDFRGTPLNRRVGVYTVDEFATHPKGGVYFRVHRGADGFGPDVMSYGFVYHPNWSGTPFGAARYRVYPLGHGWFWFKASDDWYDRSR